MGKKSETFFIKFAKAIMDKLKRCGVRLFSSKYSKKDFTQHQHIVLRAVQQKHKGQGFRCFIQETLPDMTRLCDFLELKKIPHFTTLHKAVQRISSQFIAILINEFLVARRLKTAVVGFDASGFSLTHASHHYTRKLERPKKNKGPGRPRKRRKIRRYLHTTLCVETNKTQFVLAASLRRGPRNDSPLLIPTAKKVRVPQRILRVGADRGYDAETNFEWIVKEWKAIPDIKLKNKDVPVHRTKGEHRKEAKRRLSRSGRKPKNHRNKNETVFSVIKRCFGKAVLARKVSMQNKEILFRILAYNARREVIFLILTKDFYGA